MHNITQSIQRIQQVIEAAAHRSGRRVQDIQMVAVSKTKPPEAVREAFQNGLRVFGENRVQEAEKKIAQLQDLHAEWHLIGHLQTNKVKKVLPLFQLVHSVDSVKLIRAIEGEAQKQGQTVPILLQLNLAGEATKSGAETGALEELIKELDSSPHVQCNGLMTLPPYADNPEDVRHYFRQLRELGERYQTDLVGDRKLELSMGMSHDFAIAIEEGATMVRLGTAIFGSR